MPEPTASAHGLRLRAQHDLAGHGDGMQVVRVGDALYVGHTGTSRMGTSILDVSDSGAPVLVDQWPAPEHTHSHKVQVADGLLLVNHERFPYRPRTPLGPHSAGLAVYDLADPFKPEQIGFWRSGGKGVHRIVWTGGRYAHLSATPDGYTDRIWIVIDLADPANPVDVGRWWWPGQWEGGGEVADWPSDQRHAAHHALIAGQYGYLGYDDVNLVVLDVSDLTRPRPVGRLRWDGGATHTCLPLPGRNLLVVTDEQQHDGPGAPARRIHLVDIADPAEPGYLGPLPEPVGNYDRLPMRFGPHNLHENRAGSYRSERLVFATYFSAGVRVYDLEDADRPREIAHWVPPAPPGQAVPQSNDLFVDDGGLIWVTDRVNGGLSVLEPEPELAELLERSRLI
jgi:hypothetical protein